MDAVELISSAVLGVDIETVEVGGKIYVMRPPSIKNFIGAARYLANAEKLDSIESIVQCLSDDSLPKALSWLVCGSEELSNELLDADPNELAKGIITGLSMLDPGNFTMLSALARNVRSLIAKPR